jgi:hypothetical protein
MISPKSKNIAARAVWMGSIMAQNDRQRRSQQEELAAIAKTVHQGYRWCK